MPALRLSWPTRTLTEALASGLPGIAVEVAAHIDSTNTELMRRARAGRLAPTLLVAEVQTAGRGRLGRSWQTGPAGEALSFSLGLPLAPADWSGLSLAVGLAVAESLDPRIGLKWPNDLWWQDRKLAGVLVETGGSADPAGARAVVIGVGLNIALPASDGCATPPTALQLLRPDLDAPAALQCIAPALARAVLAFERQGFAPLVARYHARDVLAGRPVRLSDGSEGLARGVGPDGALQVRTATGLREVRSAEVSVRPSPGGTPA